MGHPEATNQTFLDVDPVKTENDLNTQEEDSNKDKDVPKFIDLNSKGIKLFPQFASQGSLDSVTHLYLNYNKLASIPCDLYRTIPNLQVFSLVGNDILELPGDLCELKFLQELYVCENNLVSLPQSLYKLKHLQILKASCNDLRSLHSEIGQNECLEVLDVSENSLKRFPATLGLLKNLCVLNASKNRLDYIPQTIHFLTSLQIVNFGRNHLTTIPDSFSSLENLQHIDLSENQISKLWPNCASSHCLEKIILDSNSIAFLPAWFSQLDNICEIRAAKNNLGHRDSFPLDFGTRLQKLSKLDLRGNCIETLPSSFHLLSGLKLMLLGSPSKDVDGYIFQNGNWLTVFPDNFTDLHQLVILAAEENQLTHLPEDFGRLNFLKELNLGGNLLTSLPKSFSQLKSLIKCQLSKNKLRYLPENIGLLHDLTELYLDRNKLKVLPPSLENCTQLEILDLRKNRFIETPHVLQALTGLKDLKLIQSSRDGDYLPEDDEDDMKAYGDSDDEGNDDDDDVERESRSPVFDVWSHTASTKEEEENWDDDVEHSKPEVTEEEEVVSAGIEAGQFDVDGDESGSTQNHTSSLTFDYYGNPSQRIDLDIGQHRMLPYLLHQPKQTWWHNVSGQDDDDQFEDA